jgi:hypothetical protein
MMKVGSILYTSRYSQGSLKDKTWNSKPKPSEYKHHCNSFFVKGLEFMSSVPLGFTLLVSGMRTQYRPGEALAMFSRDQNPWRSESVNSGCISTFVFRGRQMAASYRYRNIECPKTWCVSSLLSLMCEVNGFIFVRTVQRTANRRWRGSNVPAFNVRFCLSSVWLIYDPVSSKTSCFKQRIRECVKLDSLFQYCAQLTGVYCMVVVC